MEDLAREILDASQRLRQLPVPSGGWVTRFAPSPTGPLHLGHLWHAQWVWGIADAIGARVLLRMEDHDRGRCRAEYEDRILADLDWLGLVPDAISRASLAASPSAFRQSDHPERYAEALRQIRETAEVYPCHCTRSMMAPPDADGERRHDDACRTRGGPDTEAALRVALPDRAVHWTDLRTGDACENPWRRHGDPSLRDARGQWSYQWCVVVDDLHDGVNLVVRGEDIRASTARQVLLRNLLGGGASPMYCHHSLLLGPDRQKLSKRIGSASLAGMRATGRSAAEVHSLAAGASVTASESGGA